MGLRLILLALCLPGLTGAVDATALELARVPRHTGETRGLAVLHGQSMGMAWSAKLNIPLVLDIDVLRDGIQAQLDAVDRQMSTWKPDSALSRFNRAPAGTWQNLPDELFMVLSHALAVARDSGGAFDPTVGPLVELWGFGPSRRAHQPPGARAIAAARARVGWWRIRLDPEHRRAWQPGGVELDLSAVAKGFAVDQAARWLLRRHVDDFLLEVGGELRAHGHKPDGQAWHVAVQRPDPGMDRAADRHESEPLLVLDNLAVATSGDYRHFFESGKRRFSHHIDPRTGQPVAYQVASVTVVASRCVDADPVGTTLSVLGPEKGLAWARERNLAVLMIVRSGDGALHPLMTPAFDSLLIR